MSSITKRMKKLSVQQQHYGNSLIWSRVDVERARDHDLKERAHTRRLRKTHRPVDCAFEGVYWIPRKTPDRSVLKLQWVGAAR